MLFTWLSRNVFHLCDGGRLRCTMYLLTLVSPMSIPSFSSSPWIFGAPQRIVAAHRANELAQFFRQWRPPRLAMPNLPCPKQAKALAMPSEDRRRLHDDGRRF